MSSPQDTSLSVSSCSLEFAGKSSQFDLSPNYSNLWPIDSGVSCHIVTHKNLFTTLFPVKSALSVYLPNGSSCTPKFKESVTLFPNVTLQDVYLIPEFKVNLIFVSCITHTSNLALVFLPTKCLLQDLSTNHIIGEAHWQGNLYQLNTPMLSHHLQTVSAKVWHQRLGHASAPVLSHLDIHLQDSHKPCDPCHFSKQHRLPFPKIPVSASVVFHLLHINLWGPYKTPNLNGAHYFIIIVDDYSRST